MADIPHQQPSGNLWNSCHLVAEQGVPLCPRTPYEGPRVEFRRTEDVILPLAEDGVVVDTLLVFVAFLPRI